MTDIEKLLALEEIKALKARYFRFVDTKDWAGLRGLFADDARFDAESGVGAVDGANVFVAAARDGLAGCVSVHHGHCPEIAFTSETTATGIWAMEDRLRWEDGTSGPLHTLHGYGHYHETYAKISDRWLITSWKLTRLRLDTISI
jgi:hypothetical protein